MRKNADLVELENVVKRTLVFSLKFRFDTAENEPANICNTLQKKNANFANSLSGGTKASSPASPMRLPSRFSFRQYGQSAQSCEMALQARSSTSFPLFQVIAICGMRY